MKNKSAEIISKEKLLQYIKNDFLESLKKDQSQVLIAAGAGDVDQIVQPIKDILSGND